jgi:hypothetical protein
MPEYVIPALGSILLTTFLAIIAALSTDTDTIK